MAPHSAAEISLSFDNLKCSAYAHVLIGKTRFFVISEALLLNVSKITSFLNIVRDVIILIFKNWNEMTSYNNILDVCIFIEPKRPNVCL